MEGLRECETFQPGRLDHNRLFSLHFHRHCFCLLRKRCIYALRLRKAKIMNSASVIIQKEEAKSEAMLWQFATWHFECLTQFSTLLRDPIYHGTQVPHGKGEPVLLIPGFLAGDWTLLTMAKWLSRIGYRPYLSGIDLNVGAPERTAQQLGWRLDHIIKETGGPVIVIGHSLGGILGRFLGAQFPQSVCSVVALGAPLHDPLRATHPLVRFAFNSLQALWRVFGYPLPAHEFFHSVAFPLPQNVGFTAIFSQQDEIVDWRSCLDPDGDNQEVSGRHVSLIVNREVYYILAQILASCSADFPPGSNGARLP